MTWPSVSLWDGNTSFAHLPGSPRAVATLFLSHHLPPRAFYLSVKLKESNWSRSCVDVSRGLQFREPQFRIPFSYKWLQFPTEVSGWVGDLPQVFRLFVAKCQAGVLTKWVLGKLPVRGTHWKMGMGRHLQVMAERLGSGRHPSLGCHASSCQDFNPLLEVLLVSLYSSPPGAWYLPAQGLCGP